MSNIPEDHLESEEGRKKRHKPPRPRASLKSDPSDKSGSSFRLLRAKQPEPSQGGLLQSFEDVRLEGLQAPRAPGPPEAPDRPGRLLIEQKPPKKKRFKFFDALKKPSQDFIEL